MATTQVLLFVGALVSRASANSNLSYASGSYFALPGIWLGDDSGTASGTQASTSGRVYLDIDLDSSANGYIADGIMLQICDGRADCNMVVQKYNTGSFIEFFKRDSDKTAYLHRSRCADGATASNTTAPLSGGLYKKCLLSDCGAAPLAHFQLPPYLCETSCDKDARCTMFTVDAAQQNCWLSAFGHSAELTAVYFKAFV